MNDNTINAVIPQNFRPFLESIGEIERIDNGECRCLFCNKTVGLENIYSVFPQQNEVKYCCSDLACVMKLSELCKNSEEAK